MNRRKFTKITLAGSLLDSSSSVCAADKNPAFKSKFGPTFNQLPTAPKGYLDQLEMNGVNRRKGPIHSKDAFAVSADLPPHLLVL